MPFELTKNWADSSYLGSIWFFKIRWKTIQHPKKEALFSLCFQKIKGKVLDVGKKLFLKWL